MNLAAIRNLIGPHSTLHSALPEYDFFNYFILFMNFSEETLHLRHIKRQQQDIHNEIQYITAVGFPQQRNSESLQARLKNIEVVNYHCKYTAPI